MSCNFGLKSYLWLTNCTPATWSCNFVITRMISDQIALHSVQLPLLISLNCNISLTEMRRVTVHVDIMQFLQKDCIKPQEMSNIKVTVIIKSFQIMLPFPRTPEEKWCTLSEFSFKSCFNLCQLNDKTILCRSTC